MVLSDWDLTKPARTPDPREIAMDTARVLIQETSQRLSAQGVCAEMEYPLRTPVADNVVYHMQTHYAPQGWQVTSEGSKLKFKFFEKATLKALSDNLEVRIDALLRASDYKEQRKATIQLPQAEPLVETITLQKYLKADPFMRIKVGTMPGRGRVAVFEYDTDAVTQAYLEK
jgi:hypothetical protein